MDWKTEQIILLRCTGQKVVKTNLLNQTYRMFIVTAAISIRLTFYLQTITGLSGLMVSASPRVPKVPSSIPAKSTCLFIKLICFFVDFDTYTTGILEQTNKKTKTRTKNTGTQSDKKCDFWNGGHIGIYWLTGS